MFFFSIWLLYFIIFSINSSIEKLLKTENYFVTIKYLDMQILNIDIL
jgi:hypothetical protein